MGQSEAKVSKADLSTAEKDIVGKAKTIEARDDEIVELKKKIKNLESSLAAETAAVAKLKQTASASSSQLQKDVNKRDDEIKKLKAQIKTLQASEKELKTTIENLKNEVKKLKEDRKQAQYRIDAANGLVKEKENSLQKQVKAYDALNAKAQTLSAEKDKLTKDKYDLEQKLKKVEYNLSTANGELKTSKA